MSGEGGQDRPQGEGITTRRAAQPFCSFAKNGDAPRARLQPLGLDGLGRQPRLDLKARLWRAGGTPRLAFFASAIVTRMGGDFRLREAKPNRARPACCRRRPTLSTITTS